MQTFNIFTEEVHILNLFWVAAKYFWVDMCNERLVDVGGDILVVVVGGGL